MPMQRAVIHVLTGVQAVVTNQAPPVPDPSLCFRGRLAFHKAEEGDGATAKQIRVPAALAYLPQCPRNLCVVEFGLADLGDVSPCAMQLTYCLVAILAPDCFSTG